MLILARTVRFAVNSGEGFAPIERGSNGYAGVPAMQGLGRHYELDVRCRGNANTATGYFINIKDIDFAARRAAIPIIAKACAERPNTDPADILREFFSPLDRELGGSLSSVNWRLTPYYGVEMTKAAQDKVLMRQRFEFAASHRLHVESISDADNRATFGKCNNPSGHGHNYIVEPCVAVPLSGPGRGWSLADMEKVVTASVIDRFDHMNLNTDVPDFSAKGLNPSVENIARACFDLLAPAIAKAAPGVELRNVTVWETEKTSCTYPA